MSVNIQFGQFTSQFTHALVSKRCNLLSIRIIDMIPTTRYINMRDLPLLGISRMTHSKGEKGHENKAINKQKPTNTQNIHPKVFLHPSNKKPNTTSNPFIIQPNSPPPTQRRTISTRIPIIENISIICSHNHLI